MHKIILPNGFSCEMKEGKDFTIHTPSGYFKMIGFPHDFWDSIYEYGDNSGRNGMKKVTLLLKIHLKILTLE